MSLEGLPPQAADPLDDACTRILRGDAEIVLTGPGGTGKTTLVKRIMENLGNDRVFHLMAPTGKAARRLREVTRRTAETMHSAIYQPPRDDGEQLVWQSTKILGERGGTVVVVDEASMVDDTLAKDLRQALRPRGENGPNTILWVGDPNQLPPISGSFGVDLHGEDAIRLTKNWRSGDGIIDFSQAILRTKNVPELVRVLRGFQRPNIHRLGPPPLTDLPPAVWRAKTHESGSDATLITWRNATRSNLNREVRAYRGHPTDELVPSDLLLMRTNHHGLQMLNGELYHLTEVGEPAPDTPKTMLPVVLADVGDGSVRPCHLMPNTFGTDTRKFRETVREESLAWERLYQRGKVFHDQKWSEEARRFKSGELDSRGRLIGPVATVAHMDFGETLTCHACVHPDTLVETEMGVLPIRSIAGEGTIAGPFGPRKYNGLFVTEPRRALKITTEDGYTVTVTPEHGMDAWVDREAGYQRVEAGDLQTGHWLRLRLGAVVEPTLPVALPGDPWSDSRATRFPLPRIVTSYLAEFLGMFVADGTLYEHGFRLTKRHQDVVERFAELARMLFGFEAKVVQASDEKYIEPVYVCEVSSTYIAAWLFSLGGLVPHGKAVPSCIMASTSAIQARFLRGIFIDGSVHVNEGVLDHIELDQSHPGLIPTLRVLLLRQGIVTGRVQGRKKYDNITIYGYFAGMLVERIGLLTKFHRERAAAATVPEPTRYRIPVSREQIARARAHSSLDLFSKSDCGNATTKGFVSRATAARLPSMSRELDFHHVRIVSIEATECVSMCVEVPDGHQFLQNGFAGWNSQGSEFDLVGVVFTDDWWMMSKSDKGFLDGKAWWYTAVTRAKQHLLLWLG